MLQVAVPGKDLLKVEKKRSPVGLVNSVVPTQDPGSSEPAHDDHRRGDSYSAPVVQTEQSEPVTTGFSASHHQLARVLDAATQVSICATDVDGTITLFNTGAEEMLGYAGHCGTYELAGSCRDHRFKHYTGTR